MFAAIDQRQTQVGAKSLCERCRSLHKPARQVETIGESKACGPMFGFMYGAGGLGQVRYPSSCSVFAASDLDFSLCAG